MNKIVRNNKEYWDCFAANDAMFYIDTKVKTPSQFWQKGVNNYETYILPVLKKYHITPKSGVDFGCGIGRHTFPLAAYFHTVTGVDISTEMIRKARAEARNRKIHNVQFIDNTKFFQSATFVDFIFSINVFQHIENIEQITSILTHFAKILNGYAYIQFDTRPKNVLYHMKNRTPNLLLPRTQRSGIRRIRRNANRIEQIIKSLGFSIIEQQNPHSDHHFFLLKITQP